MTINERIKYLRKEILHKTQEEFAPCIRVSRSNLGAIEIGRITATDRVISDICEKFNASEEWLRTGEGEPLVQRSRNQIITDFLGDLIISDDTFKKRLIEALAELDERDWETLEKLAVKLAEKKG